jgi:hypothetical protein
VGEGHPVKIHARAKTHSKPRERLRKQLLFIECLLNRKNEKIGKKGKNIKSLLLAS